MTREQLAEAVRGLEPGESLEVGGVTVTRRYPPQNAAAGWRWSFPLMMVGGSDGNDSGCRTENQVIYGDAIACEESEAAHV